MATYHRVSQLPTIRDTHANRTNYPPENYLSGMQGNTASAASATSNPVQQVNGMLYWETDRTSMYQVQLVANVPTWVWIFGMFSVTQAALPADLGTADGGFVALVNNYMHYLRWNGSSWGYADSDVPGRVEMFWIDPSPVTGWQLCDGTDHVKYLKGDGTLVDLTGATRIPDLTSAANKAAYAKLGTPVAGPVAAVAPGFTSGGNTGNSAIGIAATDSTTPGATGNDSGAGTVVAAGAGTTVATHTHTHTSAAHAHALTDPQHNHTVPAGAVDATGEPRNLVLRPWIRL
jgi:hypothetical protein